MASEIQWSAAGTGHAPRIDRRYVLTNVGAFVVVYVEAIGNLRSKAPLLANGAEADANAAWTEIALPTVDAAKAAAEAHAEATVASLAGDPEQFARDLDILADYLHLSVPPANWTRPVRAVVLASRFRRGLA